MKQSAIDMRGMWMLNLSVSTLLTLLFAAHSAAGEPPRQRVFILSVSVHPELKVLPRDLQSRIQQELPRDLLARRNLEFEDISVYADVKQWNPEDFFNSRRKERIDRLLKERSLRMMLVFSLSAVPGAVRDERMLLTGRVYDLDKFGCLELGDGTAASASRNLPLCEAVTTTDKIASEATVDLESYKDLREGLRTLFAKLFHIPQLTISSESTAAVTLFPGQLVVTNFLLAPNSIEVEPGFWIQEGERSKWNVLARVDDSPLPAAVLSGTQMLPRETFMVEATVYQFEDGALLDQICADPEGVAERLTDFGPHGLRYSAYRARKLQALAPQAVIVPRDHGLDGFGSHVFRPSPVHGDYLLRLNLQAKERASGLEPIRSYPKYRCIRMRDPFLALGFGGMFMTANQASPFNAAAEISLMHWRPHLRSQYFFPAWSLGGIVRGSLSGHELPKSPEAEASGLGTNYFLPGLSGHFRLSVDLLRLGYGVFNLATIFEVGLGAIRYPRLEKGALTGETGWSATFHGGVGGGVFLSTNGVRYGFLVLYQLRLHFASGFGHDGLLSGALSVEIPLLSPARARPIRSGR